MNILEENFSINFKNNEFFFYNVAEGMQPFLVEKIQSLYLKNKIFVILDNNQEIERYASILKALFKRSNLLEFPSWDTIPYDYMSPAKSLINKRFKTFKLRDKIINSPYIILTTIDSIIQKVPSYKDVNSLFLKFETNCTYNITKIRMDLENLGYKNVTLVLEPNEYAVRGGIIDIWPLGEEVPYRMDFFGEKIEEIKSFNPISQISKNKHDCVFIEGPIEAPLNTNNIKNFIQNYRENFGPVLNKELFVHKIINKDKLEGIEHWLPLFFKSELENILNFFSPNLIIAKHDLFHKLNKKQDYIKKTFQEKLEIFEENRNDNNGPLDPNQLYMEVGELKKTFNKHKLIFINDIDSQEKFNSYNLNSKDNIEFFGVLNTKQKVSKKIKEILKNNLGKKKIIFCFNNDDEKKYIESILLNFPKEVLRTSKSNIEGCMDNLYLIDLLYFPLNKGFETNLLKLISIKDIINLRKTKKERKLKNNIVDFSQLNLDDYVVHRDHGIGKYIGMKTILMLEKPHDCLVIQYLNDSKLYVPVENINLISRYGSSLSNVELDKLGSVSWKRRKSLVKNKIRDLANSLITITAKRNLQKARKLYIDQTKLNLFTEDFSYIETEDQIATLSEVYRDLSSSTLMDRLVCGDVGFGKTEIALRAAFVVAQNNLKTLIVVPSTLLAKQHFETFSKRFRKFAKVETITRFTNNSKKKIILEKFCNEDIKILISTHSIFSADLSDANLGLIVIDEEQHFGVAQKEKIKKFKENVNILTLSATPIPRTLYMSLLGIKELSLIKTPPVDRKAVQTYICRFDKTILQRAVNFELNRNGQIFVVVPKIRDIEIVLGKIRSSFSEMKLGVAHGKLKTKEIELVMEKFYNHKIDLLISTSIIEAGLDIPKANTLIVYKSNFFGLAQLHQLRGRIGRTDIKGFAYFSIEKNSITENATRRLKALKAMDKLGAGINLANYDLDIRGAGNLLGEEQSGQIIQVGIELYQKLLKECLDDLKSNKKIRESSNIDINIKLAILIPESYIPDLSLRLSLYRKLGEIKDIQEINTYKEEMKNRFGSIPNEFKNLIDIIWLKVLCSKANIVKINITNKKHYIFFNKNFNNYSDAFIKWVTTNKSEIILNNTHNIEYYHNIEDPEKQLLNVIDLTNKIIKLIENNIKGP